jgi:tetratricopeptide (TPR) repeat protein
MSANFANFLLVVTLALFSCKGKYADQIYNPNPTTEYYRNSIDVLEDELDDQSENLELIELQLSYYKYLGWPEIEEAALKRAEKYATVSPTVRQYLLEYYRYNELNKDLVDLLNNLERLGSISQKEKLLRIQSLVAMGEYDRSLEFLNKLDPLTKEEMHLELARAYQSMDNQPLAMYHFYKAHLQGKKNESMIADYVPTLLQYRYFKTAQDVLLYNREFAARDEFDRLNAEILYGLGNRDSAEQILKGIRDENAYLTLATWYSNSLRYDSAVVYYNKILQADSSRQDIIIAIADINQSRNYLTQARTYYELAAVSAPEDKYIQEQLDNVNRKIAYLQRIREQQEKIPLLEIERKRANN